MKYNILMLDLSSQHAKIKTEIDAAIHEVIASSAFIKGEQVYAFENELANYLGVKHVIGCGNGTDALQISLMALGLKKGDEIIVPAYAYAAAIEVVLLLGLIPIMVDVDPNTFNINTDLIEDKITNKTKAIIPVDLFGQSANMEEILRIANQYNLFVVEDNAQSLGAVYTFANGEKKRTGCMGNIGTTSFFPSKNLGCMGDGGAIFTNNDELAKKIRMIANHGQERQYVHDVIGTNSRLDSLQAAILRVKLKYLNEYEMKRNQIADFYDSYFKNNTSITIPYRDKKSSHVFHQYTIQLSENINRDEVKLRLQNIGIASMVYYPIQLWKQKAYSHIKQNRDADFPTSNMIRNTVLSLPIHTEMNVEIQTNICVNLINIIEALQLENGSN